MAVDASVATTARFTSATRASSALAAALTTRRVRVADLPRLPRRGFAVPARASRFPATTADIFSRCVARGGATLEVKSRWVRVLPTGGETRAEL
jgi:hypothetical protein